MSTTNTASNLFRTLIGTALVVMISSAAVAGTCPAPAKPKVCRGQVTVRHGVATYRFDPRGAPNQVVYKGQSLQFQTGFGGYFNDQGTRLQSKLVVVDATICDAASKPVPEGFRIVAVIVSDGHDAPSRASQEPTWLVFDETNSVLRPAAQTVPWRRSINEFAIVLPTLDFGRHLAADRETMRYYHTVYLMIRNPEGEMIVVDGGCGTRLESAERIRRFLPNSRS